MQGADWHMKLESVLDSWASDTSRKVVISPDVDGLLSACILNSLHPLEIIGIYTTTHLILLDHYTKSDARKALFLDHDVSQPGVKSIGQHLVLHKDSDTLSRRDKGSWNPNIQWTQSWESSFKGLGGKKKDKYPYGTAHFLWDLRNRLVQPTPEQTAILAHADGTWFAVDCYTPNAAIWRDLMFSKSSWVDLLFDYRNLSYEHKIHKSLVDDLTDLGYKSQSRSPKANQLSPELKYLTGHQSLNIRAISNQQKYLTQTTQALEYISGIVGSKPSIGASATSIHSGTRKSEYPNRIEDLETLMVQEKIFSHAFTDLRTISYTTNLDL
jgi:hypothetical protein